MRKSTVIHGILIITLAVATVSLLSACGASVSTSKTSFKPVSEKQPFAKHDVNFNQFKRKPIVTWRFEGQDIEHPIGAVGFHIYAGHEHDRLVQNFDQTVWANLYFYNKDGDQIASVWTPEGNVDVLNRMYTQILELLESETFFEMHLHTGTGVYASNSSKTFYTDLSDWTNGAILIVPVN